MSGEKQVSVDKDGNASYLLRFSENSDPIVTETFSRQEAKTLEEYVTDVSGNVYAWKPQALTPEQGGALLSRYSRTKYTGKRLLLNEFLPNANRGAEFLKAWFVQYGDESIQEMAGSIHVSYEYVSLLAAMNIVHHRLGSFIEKSTRYVNYSERFPNGDFRYYRDPDIMKEPALASEFTEVMDGIFSAYSSGMAKMAEYMLKANPIEKVRFAIDGKEIGFLEVDAGFEQAHGITKAEIIDAWRKAAEAGALDVMRNYLPMCALTHVGSSMNSRSYEYMINRMMSSKLYEDRFIGDRTLKELSKIIPVSLERIESEHGAKMRDYLRAQKVTEDSIASAISHSPSNHANDGVGVNEALYGDDMRTIEGESGVTLIDYSHIDEQKALNAILFAIAYKDPRLSHYSAAQLKAKVSAMPVSDKVAMVQSYVGKRSNRRHMPGRPFELVDYTFGFVAPIGILRDLRRHRMATTISGQLGVDLGYEVYDELKQAGLAEEYVYWMERAKDLYRKLVSAGLKVQAQYVVPLAYNTRWLMKMNLRQMHHFTALRSQPAGHIRYRRIAVAAAGLVEKVNPALGKLLMEFVDKKDVQLGRINSMIRLAQKSNNLQKKA